jgi:hypothetical protein
MVITSTDMFITCSFSVLVDSTVLLFSTDLKLTILVCSVRGSRHFALSIILGGLQGVHVFLLGRKVSCVKMLPGGHFLGA